MRHSTNELRHAGKTRNGPPIGEGSSDSRFLDRSNGNALTLVAEFINSINRIEEINR